MSMHPAANLVRSPVTWLALVAIIVASGASYWQSERAKAQQLFERERVAADQAELRRTRESEEQRERVRQQLAEDFRLQKNAEEVQRQQAIAIRQSEVQKKQFVADDRYVSPQQSTYRNYQMLQDQLHRESEDRKQRYEDEDNLLRARQEVERQKRYLQQREYEEQVARARRDDAARFVR